MSSTLTCHMKTSSIFLNSSSTFRTPFNSYLFHFIFSQIKSLFPFLTSVILMRLFTLNTIMLATQFTVNFFLFLQNFSLEYLLTVWTETSDIFIWMCIDIFRYLDVKYLLKFLLTQNFGNVMNVDKFIANFIIICNIAAP
jgi:hypothetical protein